KNQKVPSLLQEKLDAVEVVNPELIPSDCITMNSEVSCVFESVNGSVETIRNLKLVFPQNSNIEKGQISVLSALGSALLGSRIKSSISYCGPDGSSRKINLMKMVYQPEESGDWHL